MKSFTRVIKAIFGVFALVAGVVLILAGFSDIYACTSLYSSQANLPPDKLNSGTWRAVSGFVQVAIGYWLCKGGKKWVWPGAKRVAPSVDAGGAMPAVEDKAA